MMFDDEENESLDEERFLEQEQVQFKERLSARGGAASEVPEDSERKLKLQFEERFLADQQNYLLSDGSSTTR